jgi:hypothetical protein
MTDGADARAGGRAPAPFRDHAADSALGEALLDALPLVFALGYAADASRCRALCGMTWRTGDSGATNDMIVQSLRRQCGEREVRAAKREGFLHPRRGYAIGGSTQLIRAAILNNLPRVPQLVQLGALLDVADERLSFSALHWASRKGHEHIVKALLDGKYEGKGANIEKSDAPIGRTPLIHACRWGREAVARLLLSRGANVAARDGSGNTALGHARTDSIEALLKAHGATL